MLPSVLVILPFLTAIHAANDWTKPCVSGQCSYDLPKTSGTPASGTVKIWGSENAITDITTAAGWQILGCDPKALSQNVRLVCMNEDDPTSNCAHLYQNNGAVNKIVRLPENCGASPFARISKSWVPDDQSIPASIKARLVRRGGSTPTVKALAIDTDFGSVDGSKTGNVHFSVDAANYGNAAAAAPVVTPAPRAQRRGLLDGLKSKFKEATSEVGKIGGDVTSLAGKVGDKVTSVAGEVASKVETAASQVTSAVGAANAFNPTKDFNIPPVTFDKQSNLFSSSLACGPVQGAVSVDMDANVNAQPTLSFTVAGTFVPPILTGFSAVAGLSGSASGTVTVHASITGQIDSGKVNLFSSTIPGLEIPGILEIGPIFDVNAEFAGQMDIEMDLTVAVNLQLDNAKLTFPPDDSAKPVSSAFSLGDTPLHLSATPSVQASGLLTAHIIPTISFGVKALGGKGDATIFIDLDTSAALQLNFDASGSVTKDSGSGAAPVDNSTLPDVAPTTDNSTTVDDSAGADNSTSLPTADDSTTADASTAVDASAGADNSTALPTADDSTTVDNSTAIATRAATVATGTFGGCVALTGGIAVNAGATGNFFGLFDKTANVALFNKNFNIFNKCFGDAATPTPTRRRRMRRVAARNLLLARAFSCPAAGVADPAPVADETVAASSITPA